MWLANRVRILPDGSVDGFVEEFISMSEWYTLMRSIQSQKWIRELLQQEPTNGFLVSLHQWQAWKCLTDYSYECFDVEPIRLPQFVKPGKEWFEWEAKDENRGSFQVIAPANINSNKMALISLDNSTYMSANALSMWYDRNVDDWAPVPLVTPKNI